MNDSKNQQNSERPNQGQPKQQGQSGDKNRQPNAPEQGGDKRQQEQEGAPRKQEGDKSSSPS